MHQSSPKIPNASKSPKVIVLAGIAGLDKEKIATDFRKCILKHFPDAAEDSIPYFLAEDPDRCFMQDFLAEELSNQRGILEKSYFAVAKAISDRAKDPSTLAILVPVHLTFMYADRILSPLSWPSRKVDQELSSVLHTFIRAIRPDYIVNLIDDAHYIQNRQKRKGVCLTLRDIFKWRELETLVADHIANDAIHDGIEPTDTIQYEHSPLVAVRHSSEMLYKYIFEPEVPRLYTSFLISEIKNPRTPPDRAKSMRLQVNTLTTTLDREFCVFNPLTIDELPLRNLLTSSSSKSRSDIINHSAIANRWRIPHGPALTRDNVREIKDLSKSELAEIFKPHSLDGKCLLERQVRARDIRLIDQSDAMVVYRPTNKLSPDEEGSYWGGGCLEESLYSQFIMSFRTEFHIYIIVDAKDKPVEDRFGAGDGALSKIVRKIRVIKNNNLNLDIPQHQKQILEETIRQIHDDASSLTRWRRATTVAPR